jgi:hypothetical protein
VTSFSSGKGGGDARQVSYSDDGRYSQGFPGWDDEAGATFSLATWTPGVPVLLSLTATYANGYFNLPDVTAKLFGTNGLLTLSDFQGGHVPQDYVDFTFPFIMGDPPNTQTADITSIVQAISGQYSHLGIVFFSGGSNVGNIVDFNVRLVSDGFVPEPSSAVLGATAMLAGLAATLRRELRSDREGEHRREAAVQPR